MDRRLAPCALFIIVGVLLAAPFLAAGQQSQGFLPGQRVLLDAHNCYPYGAMFADRLQRALSTGVPVAIEIDQAWYTDPDTQKSWAIVAHGAPFSGKEPTLRDYFFEQVRPLVENALREGNKGNWPLITLNLNDLRCKGPGIQTALWNTLTEYEGWLCTATKGEDPATVAPLDVKPILILTASGEAETKTFYDQVPVGGKLRMFGSDDRGPATNFRRWRNHSWRAVEPEGQPKAKEWTPEKAARLKRLVDEAHKAGYWIRFYTLDGDPFPTAHGWGPDYNFGTLEAAQIRWKACIEAGVDFVATDLYEAFAEYLRKLGH